MRMKDELIDVYIRPRIEGYGLLDYGKLEEIQQAGYDAAFKSLSEWKKERSKLVMHETVAATSDNLRETKDDSALEVTGIRPIEPEDLLRQKSSGAIGKGGKGGKGGDEDHTTR